MCISVVEPAALWLRVWVCGVEKGPSGDLWTELERRRNGGLAREKDEFHLDLLGRSVRSLYIMIIDRSMSVPKQAQADLPEDPFHFFSEKAPRDGCPHSAPDCCLCPCLHQSSSVPRKVSCCPKLFFFFFQTKVQLIYNVVLISGTQQSYSVIYIIFHYGLSQHIEYSSLCYQ